jgi:hypothetical protein
MSSFLQDGLVMLLIVSILAGLASMPRCPTMKPKSSPDRVGQVELQHRRRTWSG